MRASVKELLGHTHWEIFFWRGISFGFGPFVFSLDGSPFSISISGKQAASIVSLGEAKNGIIFGIKFWLRVWSQNLSFFGVCGRYCSCSCRTLVLRTNAKKLSQT